PALPPVHARLQAAGAGGDRHAVRRRDPAHVCRHRRRTPPAPDADHVGSANPDPDRTRRDEPPRRRLPGPAQSNRRVVPRGIERARLGGEVMRRRLGLVAALVLGALCFVPPAGAAAAPCTTAASGGDWPVYGHDAANTRTQPDEHGLGPSAVGNLTPAWVFSTGSTGDGTELTTTPVVSDGCVFI